MITTKTHMSHFSSIETFSMITRKRLFGWPTPTTEMGYQLKRLFPIFLWFLACKTISQFQIRFWCKTISLLQPYTEMVTNWWSQVKVFPIFFFVFWGEVLGLNFSWSFDVWWLGNESAFIQFRTQNWIRLDSVLWSQLYSQLILTVISVQIQLSFFL